MIRFLPVLTLAAALASPAREPTTVDCGGVPVRLNAPVAAQGGIVLVEIADPSMTSGDVTVTWGGNPIEFWRDGRRSPLRALVGIDLEQPPGAAELLVVKAGEPPCHVPLQITPGDFVERRLTVPQRFVELSAADQARARREAQQLEAILAKITGRVWKGGFRLPIRGVEASTSFGQRRILNGEPRSPHGGVDFGARPGTPVRATAAGRVVLASPLFFAGQTVVLDHGLGLFSWYGHLSAFAVRRGRMVKAETVIGRVGASGRATGPHLHWAIRLNGARVSGLDLVAILEAAKER